MQSRLTHYCLIIIETLIDKIEEAIVEEEQNYGLLKVLGIVLLFVFLSWFLVVLCNLMSGKRWEDSIPFCGFCVGLICKDKGESNLPNKGEREMKVLFFFSLFIVYSTK